MNRPVRPEDVRASDVRASDVEREPVRQWLHRAHAEGSLDLAEFDPGWCGPGRPGRGVSRPTCRASRLSGPPPTPSRSRRRRHPIR
ncbi:DUF1707 SHOCT-like domain-containing protein [Saccharothrix sp. NRRL B-16314]|uniref:DUF1707 SHOCT-like domain-containing protein n=1 Tax=Saccharothrix sp. NRRL B-16314 TaxID=1463825 RepID=UPI000B0AA64B